MTDPHFKAGSDASAAWVPAVIRYLRSLGSRSPALLLLALRFLAMWSNLLSLFLIHDKRLVRCCKDSRDEARRGLNVVACTWDPFHVVTISVMSLIVSQTRPLRGGESTSVYIATCIKLYSNHPFWSPPGLHGGGPWASSVVWIFQSEALSQCEPTSPLPEWSFQLDIQAVSDPEAE